MSRIFVDRPIFAWVLAILVMVAGVMSLRALPLEQYPAALERFRAGQGRKIVVEP